MQRLREAKVRRYKVCDIRFVTAKECGLLLIQDVVSCEQALLGLALERHWQDPSL